VVSAEHENAVFEQQIEAENWEALCFPVLSYCKKTTTYK